MNFRKVLFWAHLSAGLVVGLAVLVIAGTGILLSFEKQVVDFAERDLLRLEVPAAPVERPSLAGLAAKAKEAFPMSNVTGVSLRSGAGSPVVFNLGREGVLFVNPYTGELLGQGAKGARDFFHWAEDWHRYFGREGESRESAAAVKDAVGLAFFFMVLSGAYIWWPRNWSRKALASITRFTPGLQGKDRDWNWHNVFGFWCSLVLLVISMTGVVMSYQWATNLLYRSLGSQPPPPRPAAPPQDAKKAGEGMARAAKAPETKAVDWDRLAAAAAGQAPGWKAMNLRLPQRGGDTMTVQIEEGTAPHSYARSSLTLKTATGEVAKWEPYSEQSLGRKARSLMKPIHTGEIAGWLGQLLAGLASAGALMLVYTGAALSWRRFFGRGKA